MTQVPFPLPDLANRLRSPLPRSDEPELMDGAIEDRAELAENLRDIRRVNRLLGGVAVVERHLPALLAGHPLAEPVRVLDLATGSADIPLALLDWAERRGHRLHITASDSSGDMLAIARQHAGDRPGLVFARLDARAAELPDGAFDVVLCSLALHHFDRADAVRVLREMDRLAKTGCILNDLRRGRLGYAAAWAAAQVTTRNRLTRNDAPLSVRRAFTPAELSGLLAEAGIAGATVTNHPWFRMAAVWRKPRG